MNTVDDCRLIELPQVPRPEGSITPVEADRTIPFAIARVYYVYDVVGGSERGGHAHLELDQLIVSVMGAFTVVVDDGRDRREIELNRAYVGLHVPPMIWRELVNFSSGAVSLVLASLPYSEADYVRDRDAFVELRG
jgi:dTDP-4-dehydrorhamnose 3,5-epimerase-like enzyme